MKKIKVAFMFMLLSALFSLAVTVPAQGESIEAMTRWSGYTYKGPDTFYGEDVESVVAYKTGSTATLIVSVKNDLNSRINVSVVGISFDWQKPENGWYNSTQVSKENPVVLEAGETLFFKVNFTTPSIEIAQTVPHDYTVYVEYVNATGHSERWEKTRTDLFGKNEQYFVVYTAEQAQSKHDAQVIEDIKKQAPTWNTTKAKLLWRRAMNESSVADYYYNLGDFSQAVVHYSKALSLIDEAFTSEQSIGVSLEEAQVDALKAQVKVSEAWANFANGLSNMWTLIGVALVLFALGYIIRGLATLRRTQIPP